MEPFNPMTATADELAEEISKITTKNAEMEKIINSFGASASPMLPLELKINAVIQLLVNMDPLNEDRIQFFFAEGLHTFFVNTLPEVRKRALMPDPNAPQTGLLLPGS